MRMLAPLGRVIPFGQPNCRDPTSWTQWRYLEADTIMQAAPRWVR